MKTGLFIKTLSNETTTIQVDASETIYGIKSMIFESSGIDVDLQKLVWSGICLDNDKTVLDYEIPEDSTLHLSLGLMGGKKGKKKVYTTKKKNHHKHKNVKLAVLKFYNIDAGGHITPARKMCPTCGVGIFMAKHFDRLYCGKCGTTFKLDAKDIQKPKEKKKEEVVVEETTKKGAKKDAAAKGGKEAKKEAGKGGKDDKKAAAPAKK